MDLITAKKIVALGIRRDYAERAQRLYAEGLTLRQIAEIIGKSHESVRTGIKADLKKLDNELELLKGRSIK